eukprot:scaffold4037_cov400-Prasinococcus_capsulatus_cf.AAC.6
MVEEGCIASSYAQASAQQRTGFLAEGFAQTKLEASNLLVTAFMNPGLPSSCTQGVWVHVFCLLNWHPVPKAAGRVATSQRAAPCAWQMSYASSQVGRRSSQQAVAVCGSVYEGCGSVGGGGGGGEGGGERVSTGSGAGPEQIWDV